MRESRLRIVWLALAGAILLLTAPFAFSQQCALCYTQAASSGRRMIEALQSGILVLVVPPTLGSIGMVFLVHRRTNQTRNEDDSENSGDNW